VTPGERWAELRRELSVRRDTLERLGDDHQARGSTSAAACHSRAAELDSALTFMHALEER